MILFSDFLRTCYAPTYLYGQRSLATIGEYMTSACYYLELVGDCRLDEIDPAKNARFLKGLQALGLSNETIRKHCRHLNTIWAKAGPPLGKHRDALRFVPEAPWIRPPQSFKKLPREIPDSYADQLYEATETCDYCYEYPKKLERLERPLWWKALIALASTSAIRRKILFNLTWDSIDIGRKYFVVPAEIDKKKTERIKPLHPEVYRLLEAIRSGPYVLPWTHGTKAFYESWHDLNEKAGIMPHLKLHDLKRYSLQLACRSGVDAATLQLLGDHASIQTTLNHYVRGNLENYIASVRLPGSKGGEQ